MAGWLREMLSCLWLGPVGYAQKAVDRAREARNARRAKMMMRGMR